MPKKRRTATSATAPKDHPAPAPPATPLSARERAAAFASFRFPPPRGRLEIQALQSAPLGRALAAVPLPATFDWRTRVAIAPPGDQGKCNACTSFALAATIEASWLVANPGRPITVSAGFIHTCLGHEGNSNAQEVCQSGIDLFRALRLVQARGYALAVSGGFPFPAASCQSTPTAGRIAQFPAFSRTDEAKAHLVRVGPIVADMYIWQDFLDYSVDRAPTYVPDTSRTPMYVHSVCVVGFEPRGWIIKNSFGPAWGDGGGFAIVSYGACGLIGAPPPPDGHPRETFGVVLQSDGGPGQA